MVAPARPTEYNQSKVKQIRSALKHSKNEFLLERWLSLIVRVQMEITPAERDYRRDEYRAIEQELKERGVKIVYVTGHGFHTQYSTSDNKLEPILPKVKLA